MSNAYIAVFKNTTKSKKNVDEIVEQLKKHFKHVVIKGSTEAKYTHKYLSLQKRDDGGITLGHNHNMKWYDDHGYDIFIEI